jgi:uncharacterized membrane protein
MLLAEAPVWTFWMGVLVFLLIVPVVLAVAIGYLVKVVRPKYPPRSAQQD